MKNKLKITNLHENVDEFFNRLNNCSVISDQIKHRIHNYAKRGELVYIYSTLFEDFLNTSNIFDYDLDELNTIMNVLSTYDSKIMGQKVWDKIWGITVDDSLTVLGVKEEIKNIVLEFLDNETKIPYNKNNIKIKNFGVNMATVLNIEIQTYLKPKLSWDDLNYYIPEEDRQQLQKDSNKSTANKLYRLLNMLDETLTMFYPQFRFDCNFSNERDTYTYLVILAFTAKEKMNNFDRRFNSPLI